MKKIFQFLVGFVVLLMAFGCGANNATEIPALTNTPISPTVTPTSTPQPTRTPIPTPTLVFVTLGSPFVSDCGDGIPRIWSNDSYNSRWYPKCNDDHHGHVDIFVPSGCNVNNYEGEVIAPISGFVQKYTFDGGWGYHISLPDGVLIDGIEQALKFSGIENPNLRKISSMGLDLGHVNLIEGKVEQGQVIGNIVPCCNGHQKLAYKVSAIYEGREYVFTPTLFNDFQEKWSCVSGSPYDCIPEVKDYSPSCPALKTP